MEAYGADSLVPDGDRVICMGTERVRGKATGKVYEGRWVPVITIRDGKIARFEEQFDTDATALILAE